MWCRRPPIVRRRRPSRAMAAASAVGDGGDIALAEGSEICRSRPCGASRAGAVRSRLAHDRSRRAHRAARTRRSLAAAALWPRPTALPPVSALATLPVPRRAFSKSRKSARLTLLATPRRAGRQRRRPVATEASSAKVAGKSRRHGRAAAAQPPAPAGHSEPSPQQRPTHHRQAGGASQTEWAIGPGRRSEEALNGRS